MNDKPIAYSNLSEIIHLWSIRNLNRIPAMEKSKTSHIRFAEHMEKAARKYIEKKTGKEQP